MSTLTKKGNLQQCQNYRTVSLISHPSKIMLKIHVIQNRLQTQKKKIVASKKIIAEAIILSSEFGVGEAVTPGMILNHLSAVLLIRDALVALSYSH